MLQGPSHPLAWEKDTTKNEVVTSRQVPLEAWERETSTLRHQSLNRLERRRRRRRRRSARISQSDRRRHRQIASGQQSRVGQTKLNDKTINPAKSKSTESIRKNKVPITTVGSNIKTMLPAPPLVEVNNGIEVICNHASRWCSRASRCNVHAPQASWPCSASSGAGKTTATLAGDFQPTRKGGARQSRRADITWRRTHRNPLARRAWSKRGVVQVMEGGTACPPDHRGEPAHRRSTRTRDKGKSPPTSTRSINYFAPETRHSAERPTIPRAAGSECAPSAAPSPEQPARGAARCRPSAQTLARRSWMRVAFPHRQRDLSSRKVTFLLARLGSHNMALRNARETAHRYRRRPRNCPATGRQEFYRA